MIKKYNNLSYLFFIPGIIAQVTTLVLIANAMTLIEQQEPDLIVIYLPAAVGALILSVGCAFYAKARGRSPFWGIVGFLGLPGLFIISLLKDWPDDSWNT